MMNRMLVATAAVVALGAAGVADAQAVTTCDAVALYAHALSTGTVCQNVPDFAQNLWVCELRAIGVDAHLTFNANTPLHFTTRAPRPDGSPNYRATCDYHIDLRRNGAAFAYAPAGVHTAGNVAFCGLDSTSYLRTVNAVAYAPVVNTITPVMRQSTRTAIQAIPAAYPNYPNIQTLVTNFMQVATQRNCI